LSNDIVPTAISNRQNSEEFKDLEDQMDRKVLARILKDFPWLCVINRDWSPRISVKIVDVINESEKLDQALIETSQGKVNLWLYIEHESWFGHGKLSDFEERVVPATLTEGKTARYEIFNSLPGDYYWWRISFAVVDRRVSVPPDGASGELEVLRMPDNLPRWTGYDEFLRMEGERRAREELLRAEKLVQEISTFYTDSDVALALLQERFASADGRSIIRIDGGTPALIDEFYAKQKTMFERRKATNHPAASSLLQRHVADYPSRPMILGGGDTPTLDSIERRRDGISQAYLGKWSIDE
jgi:hypothetical protein